MAKITYNTKKLRVNTPATTEEIFSFNDANEIKASVNALYDTKQEEIQEYSATKTYGLNDVAWFSQPKGNRLIYQSTIENNINGFTEEEPTVVIVEDPITIDTGLMFPDQMQMVTYDENLEAYFPPSFYGSPEIIRVKLKVDDGRAVGFYYDNVQIQGVEPTTNISVTIKETSNSTINTEIILTKDFWNGNAFLFYKATNGNSYKIIVDFSVSDLVIELSSADELPKWVLIGEKQEDVTKFVRLTPASAQDGNINISGYVLAEAANFQAASLVESLIVNKTNIPAGQQPISGFAQLLPNKLTFNDNDYNTGYSADAVYGSSSLSLWLNGKGKFTLSKLGDANNDVQIKVPDTNGTLALLTDIPAPQVIPDFSTLAPKASPAFTGVPTAPMAAQLSNDDTIVTSKWVWDHDVLNNISKFGYQEQTGWLTLKNWLTFKKINGWANSTNAGNLSYSDTHRWVFMSSSDSTKNIGFEILPSETKTVIRLTLPVTGGTIARLEDIPNAANFAKVNDYNVFTYNNTFEGYSTFQGGTFNGNLNVNSGKRTMLGGGVDVYQDFSIYSGIGKIVMNAEYTEQAHSITIPAKTGTFALLSDIPAPADTSLFLKNFDDGANKFQIDVVDGLYLRGGNGSIIMNRDAVTLYPSTGGNITMSNTAFGFTRGDNISFYLDENRLLLQPAWNKSAIIKIDPAATGHEEYTLPMNGGTLAVTEKINYLTAPDGTKWYIENDGTFSNHLAG